MDGISRGSMLGEGGGAQIVNWHAQTRGGPKSGTGHVRQMSKSGTNNQYRLHVEIRSLEC